MIRRIVIPRHERGFLYRDGDFQRILGPGVHWLFDWRPLEVKRVSQLAPRIDLPDIELLAREPEVAREVLTFRVSDTERGLLFRDGNFAGFLGPGVHAFLRGPIGIKVDVVDIQEAAVSHALGKLLAGFAGSAQHMKVVDVPEGHRGLLYLDKVRTQLLEPGRHLFWTGARSVEANVVDLREKLTEIQGQELMTADKVSVRVNLSVRHQVTDPVMAVERQASFTDSLYRDLQLALRTEIGALTLDELLAKKDDMGARILDTVRPAAEAMGMRLVAAGIRDVILPGEMRTILNQVIEAEKRAQANMITRREETAATRSLLNTAKLMEQNPVLMRMKELESVERIAEKIGSLSVYGGLDGLMRALEGFVRPVGGGGGGGGG